MITWDRSISDGTGSLSHALTVAIYDYQRAFVREPRFIVIPYFRMYEMDADMIMACAQKKLLFRGVPFRMSLTLDCIELGNEE